MRPVSESSSIGRAAVRTIKQGEQDFGSSPDFPISFIHGHIIQQAQGGYGASGISKNCVTTRKAVFARKQLR